MPVDVFGFFGANIKSDTRGELKYSFLLDRVIFLIKRQCKKNEKENKMNRSKSNALIR